MEGLHRIGRIFGSVAERVRRWVIQPIRQSLFGAIVFWVVLALFAFTLLGWLWGEGRLWSLDRWLTNWRSGSRGAEPLDLIKVSLTTIGGIGAVAYLIIKYRERAASERSDVDDKLLTAVQQLGSTSPQVRIAGVYALADVADTYRGTYRKRVVDILCGYLRTERGHWEAEEPVEPSVDAESGRHYVTSDGAVESTILTVFRQHFRKAREGTTDYLRYKVVQEVGDDQLWCDCRIDLHGATLTEMVELSGVTFDNVTDFRGATFCNVAEFNNATFLAGVGFHDATFISDVDFSNVDFCGSVQFRNAIFAGETNFRNTAFKGFVVNFKNATFSTVAIFWKTLFSGITVFWGVNIVGKNGCDFDGATFNASLSVCRDPLGPIAFPPEFELNDDTGLPSGARWARFKENGELVLDSPAEE